MRRRQQPYLPGLEKTGLRVFGGSLLGKGNPRDARPLSLKRPLHLVMRSSQATGERSMLRPRHARRIEALIHRVARAQGVRIYRFANSGNHLHLLLRAPSRRAYQGYVRAVSGLIARVVTHAERGRAREAAAEPDATPEVARARRKTRFWDARPFTRIVEWGRDFSRARDYLLRNRLEALGFVPYRPRGSKRVLDTS